MRLIDADALKENFSNMYRDDYEIWIKEIIDNAPTLPNPCEECHSQTYVNGFDAGYELGKNDRRLLTIGEQKEEAENDNQTD